MASPGWHDEDAPRIEPQPYGPAAGAYGAAPDPDRDRRRTAYQEQERRRAARALDRYIDLNLNGGAGTEASDAAAERYVEAVGDYVLSRLQHNGHYGASVDPTKPLPAHSWQEYNATGNTCHFPGCGMSEEEHRNADYVAGGRACEMWPDASRAAPLPSDCSIHGYPKGVTCQHPSHRAPRMAMDPALAQDDYDRRVGDE